jgi:hypothetical protein
MQFLPGDRDSNGVDIVYESASILPQDFEIVSFFLGLRSWPERLARLAFLSGGVKVSFLFFVVCKLSLCFRIF